MSCSNGSSAEFTQNDLLALDKAIASGVNRVRFDTGREMQYNTVKDMMMARDLILDYLGQAAAPARRQIRIFTASGW